MLYEVITRHGRASIGTDCFVPTGDIVSGEDRVRDALKEVDLVEIMTPHHLHRQHTLDAVAAGKHISLQKPMSLNVASYNFV